MKRSIFFSIFSFTVLIFLSQTRKHSINAKIIDKDNVLTISKEMINSKSGTFDYYMDTFRVISGQENLKQALKWFKLKNAKEFNKIIPQVQDRDYFTDYCFCIDQKINNEWRKFKIECGVCFSDVMYKETFLFYRNSLIVYEIESGFVDLFHVVFNQKGEIIEKKCSSSEGQIKFHNVDCDTLNGNQNFENTMTFDDFKVFYDLKNILKSYTY